MFTSRIDPLSNFTNLVLDNNTEIILFMFTRSLKKITLKFNNIKCRKCYCMHAIRIERKSKWQRKSCHEDRDRLDSIIDIIVFENFRFSFVHAKTFLN